MVLTAVCCLPSWTDADHPLPDGVAVARPLLQARAPHRACHCVRVGDAHRHRADRLSQHRGVRRERALGVTYVLRRVSPGPAPGLARPHAPRLARIPDQWQPPGPRRLSQGGAGTSRTADSNPGDHGGKLAAAGARRIACRRHYGGSRSSGSIDCPKVRRRTGGLSGDPRRARRNAPQGRSDRRLERGHRGAGAGIACIARARNGGTGGGRQALDRHRQRLQSGGTRVLILAASQRHGPDIACTGPRRALRA